VERNTEIANIVDDPYFDIPGIVVIVGALWISNIGYWGFNQYIIQKGLAAKNLGEAKKGMLFAASLKLLIPFIVCIPGVCAYYIMNGTYNGVPVHDLLGDLLNGAINRSDDAYPFLIRNFTPVVVKGLSFAALAAAVISSLASMFNSTSTIFTMDIYKQLINKNASEKKLVNVGRMTSVFALLLALVAVYPIMGGADQAFQVIQEYSGFVFPGVVVIFGLGLLWKRASGLAAVVTAIGTFVFSIAFKFAMPDVPFLLRMGYVFACLAALFIGLSYMSKKAVPAKAQDEATVRTQLIWARVFFVAALACAAFGIIGYQIEALRLYGVEAIFFLAMMFLVLSIYLRSNAKDSVQDPQAVDIDLSLFRTDRAFNIGATAIIILLVVMYIVLW
jgi:SSS family solute:Na+ symporter